MIVRNAYARAGVDVAVEAQASRIAYEASKLTFKNRKGLIGEIITPFDDFSGLKMVNVSSLPEGSFMSLGFDTAGSKVEIAQRVGKHDTLGFDVLAMVCDDALVRGGEPVLAGSTLDIKTLGSDDRFLPIIRELAKGYVAAAEAANVAIINGEIVQMGPLVHGQGDFPYHWGAACVWFGKKDRLLTGLEIREGDALVALGEHGFRCNGISLARKVFEGAYGDEWHEHGFEGSTIGLEALKPSIIYSRFVVGLHGGFDTQGVCAVHGVSHITGGGLPEKMGRMLRPSKLGAKLDDLYDPPPIVRHCQRIGNISDKDAYGAWNMGQGMILVTPEPDAVLAEAKAKNISAKIAGEIITEPHVLITSRGVEKPGTILSYDVT